MKERSGDLLVPHAHVEAQKRERKHLFKSLKRKRLCSSFLCKGAGLVCFSRIICLVWRKSKSEKNKWWLFGGVKKKKRKKKKGFG